MDASLQPDVGFPRSGLGEGQNIHVTAFQGLANVDDTGPVIGGSEGVEEGIEGVVIVVIVPIHVVFGTRFSSRWLRIRFRLLNESG